MNNKLGIGALVVGVLLSLVLALVGLSNNQTVVQRVVEKVGEVTNFDQVGSGDALEFHKRILLGEGEQFESFRNTTGGVIYLDSLILSKHATTATSSSLVAFVGTSSAATLTGGEGLSVMDGGGIYASGTHKTGTALALENLPFGGIVDNLIYGTSTMQQSFSSSTRATDHIIGIGNRNENNRDASSTVVSIQPDEYVWFLLVTGDAEEPDEDGCGALGLTEDNNCESATSTTRGGNFEAIFHFTATSTKFN